MSPERVIIDTDPGIDDAQAILFALLSGDFRVDALTTCFGNGDIATTTTNALRLLEMVRIGDLPVYQGAADPLVTRRLGSAAGAAVHGKNGLGNIHLPKPTLTVGSEYAASELARRVMSAPGEITILSLAPMTNLALAIRLEPGFAEAVKRVVYMGGIVRGPGNVTPVATANIYNDPEAAKIVLNAGIKRLTMVGQDVTRRTRLDDERRNRMDKLDGPIAKFLHGITNFYGKYYRTIEPDLLGFPIHDLLVMVYAIRPELFTTVRLSVDIETQGALTTGMTVADLRPISNAVPNVDVCLEADGEAILGLYESVIAQGTRRLGGGWGLSR